MKNRLVYDENFMNFIEQVDLQECKIKFESWGTGVDQLNFTWFMEDNVISESVSTNQHSVRVTFTSSINSGFSTGKLIPIGTKLNLHRR